MKVLYFTKYSRNAGSSRLRSFQYFPYLEESGYEVEVSPLFSELYLKNLYAGKSVKKEILKGFIKRFFKLLSVKSYNRIVIEKELFPYVPAWAERLLRFFRIDFIVDYDDAIFHNYDLSENHIIRTVLSKKIDVVMRMAQTVIAGNGYLAQRAKRANAKVINIIPTVVDLDRYHLKRHQNNRTIVVGWIGTQSTYKKHFLPCMIWIKKAITDINLQFHVVGVEDDETLHGKISFIPWTEATETQQLLKFDIGIMPLQDSLWERGKCAYKLIQYMACGLPVIASPVGMNTDVIQHGANGFLAETQAEWLEAIQTLAADTKKRTAFGIVGRKLVEQKYSIQQTANTWIKILSE